MSHSANRLKLTVKPVTPDIWKDFEDLFGDRGACGGCWCQWWKLSRKEFERNKGAGNKQAMQRSIAAGNIPGLLAYDGAVPVGWCAVEPRDCYPGLQRSRILAPVDDTPVWSIPCFFIRRTHRRRGITVQLLKAAKSFVKQQGGKILEGYPKDPASAEFPDAFAWTGLADAFKKAGFKEVARRSPTRPVMRCHIR